MNQYPTVYNTRSYAITEEYLMQTLQQSERGRAYLLHLELLLCIN